ncbi:hypothetical protein GCM10011391_09930 [Pullulanibacillus camelliae]|uniref:NlpC/P60 domain-containing protein n=1 Tax=Pullulanibacillus camelliae TaxID=1707096 RepID=A0A8J2VJZ7_9BACL|nr:hypothetical protein [Pullulanibacillus camelliae]GGE33291.1 hypothetical protein GCM10011391_09930 [Pullulanibacillus camelliae]
MQLAPKITKHVWIMCLALSVILFSENMANADAVETTDNHTVNCPATYQQGTDAKIITQSKAAYEKTCEKVIVPAYHRYLNSGETGSFEEFAADNYYEQEAPGLKGDVTTNVTAMGPESTKSGVHPMMNGKTGYKMKAGDILVVYGRSSSSHFIGHAAIATSSKYVLEMTGPGHKSDHHTKANFFKRNTKGSSYVLVYRIKKHPTYAKNAASYAYHHMYKGARPSYFISTHLYHKDPSYCSKYVYLSYYWGAKKSSVKKWPEYTHIVTPHGLVGNFKGTFKPNKIHKVTSYK